MDFCLIVSGDSERKDPLSAYHEQVGYSHTHKVPAYSYLPNRDTV